MKSLYGRLPFAKIVLCVVGQIGCSSISGLWCRRIFPAGPDGIRWPAPHSPKGLEVLTIIQAWRVTVWPVCHHTFIDPEQPLRRPLLSKWL